MALAGCVDAGADGAPGGSMDRCGTEPLPHGLFGDPQGFMT